MEPMPPTARAPRRLPSWTWWLALAACVALTIEAEPVMQHAQATAEGLLHPDAYREAVFGARQIPGPTSGAAAGSTTP